jgi:hypothetical protein
MSMSYSPLCVEPNAISLHSYQVKGSLEHDIQLAKSSWLKEKEAWHSQRVGWQCLLFLFVTCSV